MTKNDYIEKITQNLEHLTKDELKDVAALTNAQFGVRLKVAEKEYWGKEIANLKSQLQQQALPVVPEFVAEWYEEKKNKLELAVYKINTLIDKKSFNDLTKIEKWFEGVENKPIETIFKMKEGYTVEKPQLFYLKHIDMSKRDKDHDYFAQIRNDRFEHDSVRNNTLPGVEVVGVKFTQQEIDSMQTGSYKLVPVEDGE